MGCPNGQCAGYELTDNLTFATSATWTPIAGASSFFTTTLDGAGHTITGLNVETSAHAGLFLYLARGATVRDLGLINPSVTSTSPENHAGALAGGAISDVVISGVYTEGGRIVSSQASVFSNHAVGGLVGLFRGEMFASYSRTAVSMADIPNPGRTGGLIGDCNGCAIYNSYAAGAVTSTGIPSLGGLGGLVGYVNDGLIPAVITDSYCAADATGRPDCIGYIHGSTPVTSTAATAYTAAELQTPTGYTGIYGDWNLDLDLDNRPDYYWNFGTTSAYPTLNTPEQRAALLPPAPPATVDYDANDNGLIEIANWDQLSAIRYDLDGNGDPDPDPYSRLIGDISYRRAFPNSALPAATSTRMGCPGGACTGYELTASLQGPTIGQFRYDIDWNPIGNAPFGGQFNATLDGRGHTIENLGLEGHSRNLGLFRALGGSSTVRNLELKGRMHFGGRVGSSGLLAGFTRAGALISAVSVAGQVGGLASSSTNRNAGFGGLVGTATGATIQASYGAGNSIRVGGSSYNQTSTGGGGGLVGRCLGCTITASYVVGNLHGQSANARTYAHLGGLVGYVESSPTYGTSTITDSYCYATPQGDSRQLDCIGHQTGTPAVTAASKTRAELSEPTDYTGIYENWNLDLDGNGDPDDPWIFPGPPTGGHSHAWTYPTHRNPDADHDHEHDDDHDDEHDDHGDEHDDDRAARPPADDSDYNPAADHPEIYANDRYEMAAACQIHRNADGEPTGSAITFNLGSYEGEVLLALTLWNGDHFASYERMDADHPTLNRNGQTATVQIQTTPAQTRFLLDGRPHGLRTNLLLGYADCHTDDPGAESPPPTPEPPPPPRVYRSDQHEMTATCRVTNDANGNPTTSQITFDLGDYDGEVTLHLSLWNGEYYATYESHNLTQPALEREGQTATVQITTDPAETLFLLYTSSKPTRNLLLGHADCHTAR